VKTTPQFLMIMSGVVALTGLGGAYWQGTQRSDSQKQLSALLAQMRNEDDVNKELAASEEKVKTASTALQHLSTGVVAQSFVPKFMKGLEDLGRLHGITVTGVQPQEDYLAKQAAAQQQQASKDEKDKKAPPPEPYQTQLIKFTGTGGYDQLNALFQKLKEYDQIVRVESIDISPRQKMNNDKLTGDLEFTVTLKAYIEKPEPTSSGGNA